LPKSGNFEFWGRVPTPGTDSREILHSQADPRAPWFCQISHESVQQVVPAGENAGFRPASKNIFKSLSFFSQCSNNFSNDVIEGDIKECRQQTI